MRTLKPKEVVLLTLLGCERSELRKLSDTLYVWRGILYQIIDESKALKQHKRGLIRLDHFIRTGDWYMREVGSRSLVYKKYKKYL